MQNNTLVGMSVKWASGIDVTFEEWDNLGGRFPKNARNIYTTGVITRVTPLSIYIEHDGEITCISKPSLLACIPKNYTRIRGIIQADIELSSKGKKDDKPYFAYRLFDLTDNITYYVGITTNMQRRYEQHCRCSGLNLNLNLWIQEQLQQQRTPGKEVIGTATGRLQAELLESDLITQYLKMGMPLKNTRKVEGAK